MHRVLRPVVAREFAARLRIDVVAVQSDQRPFARRKADPVEVGLGDAEVVEFAHGIGLQIDADAERAHVAHRFEDDTGHANLMERKRSREPANAAAGNDHVVAGGTVTHHALPPRALFKTRTRAPSSDSGRGSDNERSHLTDLPSRLRDAV